MADITDLEKLPQNIVALIGEIGEKQVLLRLSLLAHGTKWQAFYNLGEAGFDALLLKPETNEKIRIEVKTRQKLFTSGSNKRRYNFILSSGEYEACDFLVAYLLDTNDFFVVPKGDLRRRSVSGDYRFTVRLDENKHFSPDLNKYHKAWHILHPDFATPSDATEQDKGQKPAPARQRHLPLPQKN
jgi:hypothetical protein